MRVRTAARRSAVHRTPTTRSIRYAHGGFCQKAEIVWWAMQPGRGDREDLVAGRGHPDGVLELRRQRPVLGHRGPAVAEDLHLVAPGVDHRLDGEEHALAHDRPVFRLAVMQ